jgi:outer membrane protein OmpA-like peptidoglycan-associated protein
MKRFWGTTIALAFALCACSTTPKNVFLLLPVQDGSTGAIIVENKAGSQVVSGPNDASYVKDAATAPTAPATMEKPDIDKTFGEALRAQPELPLRFILYFETGKNTLTDASKKVFDSILPAIKSRHSTSISIVGHTDRVGRRENNFRLGFDRARKIKDLLVESGIDASYVEVFSHGEDNPLIKTEDEVPEPRNRRVEVTVR